MGDQREFNIVADVDAKTDCLAANLCLEYFQPGAALDDPFLALEARHLSFVLETHRALRTEDIGAVDETLAVATVFAARQFVSHGHILVNGKRVTIPSYQVKVGDVIEVRGAAKDYPFVLEAVKSSERDVPDYIDMDQAKLKATFARVPLLADVPYPVKMEPNLVVEYYSR